jgi:glycosyltransferase involved in cell wall biosynthesis
MKGIIEHSRMGDIMRANDLLVFPCHSDAMANVILEATASGMAIISTRTGGSEAINANGLLINSGDPADLKDKLLELITQPAQLLQFRQQSVKLAKQLGWRICCETYMSFYLTIVNGSQ